MRIVLRWLSITLCFHLLGGHLAIAQNAYELGEAALQQENYEEAIRHFTSAEENGKTFARLGYAYSQLGRYMEATRAYQDALHFKHNADTEMAMSQALLGLGYIAYRQGNFDEAIRLYTEVVKRDKAGTPEAYHNLGNIYAGRGEIEKAVTAQQQAIAEDPTFAEAYYHLGVLYSRKQDWHAAIDAYQKTVALTPTMPNPITNFPDAIDKLENTGSRKGDAAVRELKVADTEIQKYLEAVFVADTDEKPEALLTLANIYFKYERYNAATEVFNRVKKYSTSDTHTAQVSAGLTRIATDQGDTTQAITHYERAVTLGLETAEVYHNLGIAYMQKPRMDRTL